MASEIVMFLSNPFTHDARVYYEAQALLAEDYRVTVIAWDRAATQSPRETIDGVEVMRIQLPKALQRLGSTQLQLSFFWRAALRAAREQACDVIHCHDLDTLPIGLRLKRVTGAALVYDAHEVYTYMLRRDLSRVLEGAYRHLERRAVHHIDHLIAAHDAIAAYYRRLGYPDIGIVRNCKPLFTSEYTPPANERFTLLYAGILSPRRMLPLLVDVVSALPGVHLILAGGGVLAGELDAACRVHANLTYLGKAPHQQLIPLTHSADAAICLVDIQDDNNRLALANKQFEALVAGRPIIASSGSASGAFTDREQCGLVVDNTPEALRQAICTLRDDESLRRRLGETALRAALREYNWEREQQKLIALYRRLPGAPGK